MCGNFSDRTVEREEISRPLDLLSLPLGRMALARGLKQVKSSCLGKTFDSTDGFVQVRRDFGSK
jgi:hypothetical protein